MTTSVHAIQKKLSKYNAMAHAATKELQNACLDEFQVVSRWDNVDRLGIIDLAI